MNDYHVDYLHVVDGVTRLFMRKDKFAFSEVRFAENREPFLWFLDYPRMAIQTITLLMQTFQKVTPRNPVYDNGITCITMNASKSGHIRP